MSSERKNTSQESRSAGIVRTIIALIVLTAFFGTIGYSFWPQILLGIQGLFNRDRASDAEPVESRFFDVRNDSSASLSQVRGVLKMMEIDHESILKFLEKEHSQPVPVFIKDGSGPAMLDSNGLVLYYDQGVIDTSAVPFFLVFWLEGLSLGPDNILFAGGFAVYVMEAVNPESEYWGQSTDAWVKYFKEKNAYLPLEDAGQAGLPNDEETSIKFFQALLEGGSLMRWVAENNGLETARQLASGMNPEDVLSKSLDEIETSWFNSIDQNEVVPKPCRMAAGRSFLNVLCDYIDEKNP